MLRIHESAKEQWKAAKKLARELGLTKQFSKVLFYLNEYGEPIGKGPRPEVRVTLYKDFAPYSFSILWERRSIITGDWKMWFQGGLIFHGPHDNGGDGSFPSLSVNNGDTRHGWSVHT